MHTHTVPGKGRLEERLHHGRVERDGLRCRRLHDDGPAAGGDHEGLGLVLVGFLVGRDEGVIVLRGEDQLQVRLRLDLGLERVPADPVLGQGDVPGLRVCRLLPRRPVARDVDEAALEGGHLFGHLRKWRWCWNKVCRVYYWKERQK